MKIENKRGFLLASQVVKIVIAVICIIFLVYLLASIYFNKVNSQKKAEGAFVLENLDVEIKSVHGGKEPNPAGILFAKPKGWYLLSFTDAIRENKDKKPKECVGVKCLCICSRVSKYGYGLNLLWTTRRERQVAECDKNGACIMTPNIKNYEEELAIISSSEPLKYVLVKKTTEGVDISEK